MKLGNLFKKRKKFKKIKLSASPQQTGVSARLPRPGDTLPDSLKAHSQFIKRTSCSQCGAPKSLPSKTAYLYCDYCGTLIDYDFCIANAGTNAGITNTVFHRLIANVQAPLAQSKARGDRDMYRELHRQVYSQWIQECPMAVSPRAQHDADFREQLVAYLAECVVTKDLDPRQVPLDAKMQTLVASLQRIPTPGGTWMVAGGYGISWNDDIDLSEYELWTNGVELVFA